MSEVITEERYVEDLIQLIVDMKSRPGVYIGKKSISRLYQFLNGFSKAYHYMDSENKYFGGCLGFQEWIYDKYKAKGAVSWQYILLECCDNESEALDLFFQEIESYIKEKGWGRILDKASK